LPQIAPDTWKVELTFFWCRQYLDGRLEYEFDLETGEKIPWGTTTPTDLLRVGWLPMTPDLAQKIAKFGEIGHPIKAQRVFIDVHPGEIVQAFRDCSIIKGNQYTCSHCGQSFVSPDHPPKCRVCGIEEVWTCQDCGKSSTRSTCDCGTTDEHPRIKVGTPTVLSSLMKCSKCNGTFEALVNAMDTPKKCPLCGAEPSNVCEKCQKVSEKCFCYCDGDKHDCHLSNPISKVGFAWEDVVYFLGIKGKFMNKFNVDGLTTEY
jgi:predicted RNA-binding Zn-ribbon protein involved in translation (DUF1610 family)